MFEVGLIQWLQTFSSPFLDTFFQMFTHLGSHYAYMAIIPFVYWAVDRRVGARLGGLFLFSMWLNGLLKEYMILPRPDPQLVRVMADEPSPGFPSGHAQGAMTLWGYLAVGLQRKWVTWLAAILIVLLPVSRLYLGVHFPADILGGLALGAALIGLFVLLTNVGFGSGLSVRMRMLLIFVIPLLLYPLYQTGTSEQLIGFFIGFFTADMLGRQVAPYRERVSLGRQIVKLLVGYVGFAVLVALHMLFMPVGIPAVFGYSLIGIWIAMIAPRLFQLLGVAGDPAAPRVDRETRGYMRHYVATALVLFLLVLGSAAYVGRAVPAMVRPELLQSERVLVIGHRGAAGLAPENTLVGFQTAVETGVDILEMDVYLTKDGHPVVLHDPTVNRTTDGTGRVSDFTLAELQQLDAGYRFTTDGGRTYPWRDRGVRIPTLDEVLGAFPDSKLLIEFKTADPLLVDAVVAVVDRHRARGRVMFASFHDEAVARARVLVPEAPTSMGEGEAFRYVVLQKLGLGSFFRPVAPTIQVPEWQGKLRVANPGLGRLARRQGVDLHVWTVNDEEAMHRLIGVGATGIITDYPDRLQRVLATMEGRDMEQVFY